MVLKKASIEHHLYLREYFDWKWLNLYLHEFFDRKWPNCL